MRKIAIMTLCAPVAALLLANDQTAETDASPADQPSDVVEQTLLDEHNSERSVRNVPALVWDNRLEKEAREWAVTLADEGVMYHSTYEGRNKAGENLWAGSAGRFDPAAMMQAFLDERQYFSAGEFPEVTKTGKWQDVGHYTQIIWASTERVGCAIETGEAFDFLVCRYWPSGNMVGVKVG